MQVAVNNLMNAMRHNIPYSLADVVTTMDILGDNKDLFSYPKAREEFILKCRAFATFSRSINKLAWSGKQVRQWWETGKVTPDLEVAKAYVVETIQSKPSEVYKYAVEFRKVGNLSKTLKSVPTPNIPPIYPKGMNIFIQNGEDGRDLEMYVVRTEVEIFQKTDHTKYVHLVIITDDRRLAES